ncbi:hypothetical protein CJ195_11230 [Bacillus sp. UMB0899]|uniref:hypothetical protein n=1 Tax=Metabacillus schmidteae TaxID=2730405 RepID=UPI000C7FB63D|nr:hypothetical protein [Metabacillus schmidteae]PMC37328.1 hypothetical protein CJ195_11230 [Bacillus sp. UMB0899]
MSFETYYYSAILAAIIFIRIRVIVHSVSVQRLKVSTPVQKWMNLLDSYSITDVRESELLRIQEELKENDGFKDIRKSGCQEGTSKSNKGSIGDKTCKTSCFHWRNR